MAVSSQIRRVGLIDAILIILDDILHKNVTSFAHLSATRVILAVSSSAETHLHGGLAYSLAMMVQTSSFRHLCSGVWKYNIVHSCVIKLNHAGVEIEKYFV